MKILSNESGSWEYVQPSEVTPNQIVSVDREGMLTVTTTHSYLVIADPPEAWERILRPKPSSANS